MFEEWVEKWTAEVSRKEIEVCKLAFDWCALCGIESVEYELHKIHVHWEDSQIVLSLANVTTLSEPDRHWQMLHMFPLCCPKHGNTVAATATVLPFIIT